VAARSAPRCAISGFGAYERRHAEDRDLRVAARHVRPDEYADLVVGRADSSECCSPQCRRI
jgi:hypothetical protein